MCFDTESGRYGESMARRPQEQLRRRYDQAQSELVIQSADLPLGTLAGMVDSKAIDLEPVFQRRERWKSDAQSALIESFLLNVPVPPIYLSEDASGKYAAIDGKQRLRTIADFIANRFALNSLERLTEAEGYRFEDLPNEIKNALKLKPFLRVVTLLKQSSPTLKYEVFLRLNRAGEPLNRQEIRNVAYRGAFNSAIYEAAHHDFLRLQLKITDDKASAYRQMLDAEFVLRFLTLRSQKSQFSGRLANEMDNFLRDNQDAEPSYIRSQINSFNSALAGCERIWGKYAFQRSEGSIWRDQFLAGMYDAEMLAVTQLSRSDVSKLENASARIVVQTKKLFKDKKFEEAVRTGTNTPARISYRVESILEMLRVEL